VSQNPTLIIKGSHYPLQVYHHIKKGWQRMTVVRVTFDGSLASQKKAIFSAPGKGKIVLHGMNANYDAAVELLMGEIQKALSDGRLVCRDNQTRLDFPA